MKRLLVILLTISAFNFYVCAQERGEKPLSRLTYGLEWGYVATMYNGYHYNFFAPEGYRVDTPVSSFDYISNADMYLHVGYNLNTKWNLSLYVGYEGIADMHKAVPVSLRMTRYFGSDAAADRWFSFVDLGSGICIKQHPQEILTGKLGGGYRLALNRNAGLDFIVSARFIYTHPEIIYDKQPIPINRINRNNAYIGALSIGMALTF